MVRLLRINPDEHAYMKVCVYSRPWDIGSASSVPAAIPVASCSGFWPDTTKFETCVIAAGTKRTNRSGEFHPGLAALGAEVFADTDPASLADLDLVFLALPHGRSAALAAQLPRQRADRRPGRRPSAAVTGQWETYYGTGACRPMAYGLRVARRPPASPWPPGWPDRCYATAVTLSAWPLLAAGLDGPRTRRRCRLGDQRAGRSPAMD